MIEILILISCSSSAALEPDVWRREASSLAIAAFSVRSVCISLVSFERTSFSSVNLLSRVFTSPSTADSLDFRDDALSSVSESLLLTSSDFFFNFVFAHSRLDLLALYPEISDSRFCFSVGEHRDLFLNS